MNKTRKTLYELETWIVVMIVGYFMSNRAKQFTSIYIIFAVITTMIFAVRHLYHRFIKKD